jgi:hypothetical protein
MPAMRITLATRCTRAMRIFRGRIVFANPPRRERLAPGYTLSPSCGSSGSTTEQACKRFVMAWRPNSQRRPCPSPYFKHRCGMRM